MSLVPGSVNHRALSGPTVIPNGAELAASWYSVRAARAGADDPATASKPATPTRPSRTLHLRCVPVAPIEIRRYCVPPALAPATTAAARPCVDVAPRTFRP